MEVNPVEKAFAIICVVFVPILVLVVLFNFLVISRSTPYRSIDLVAITLLVARLGHAGTVLFASVYTLEHWIWSATLCHILLWLWITFWTLDLLANMLFLCHTMLMLGRKKTCVKCRMGFLILLACGVSVFLGALSFLVSQQFHNYSGLENWCTLGLMSSEAPIRVGLLLILVIGGLLSVMLTIAVAAEARAQMLKRTLADIRKRQISLDMNDKITDIATRAGSMSKANGVQDQSGAAQGNSSSSSSSLNNDRPTNTGYRGKRYDKPIAQMKLHDLKNIHGAVSTVTILFNIVPHLAICIAISLGANVPYTHYILVSMGLLHGILLPVAVCSAGVRYCVTASRLLQFKETNPRIAAARIEELQESYNNVVYIPDATLSESRDTDTDNLGRENEAIDLEEGSANIAESVTTAVVAVEAEKVTTVNRSSSLTSRREYERTPLQVAPVRHSMATGSASHSLEEEQEEEEEIAETQAHADDIQPETGTTTPTDHHDDDDTQEIKSEREITLDKSSDVNESRDTNKSQLDAEQRVDDEAAVDHQFDANSESNLDEEVSPQQEMVIAGMIDEEQEDYDGSSYYDSDSDQWSNLYDDSDIDDVIYSDDEVASPPDLVVPVTTHARRPSKVSINSDGKVRHGRERRASKGSLASLGLDSMEKNPKRKRKRRKSKQLGLHSGLAATVQLSFATSLTKKSASLDANDDSNNAKRVSDILEHPSEYEPAVTEDEKLTSVEEQQVSQPMYHHERSECDPNQSETADGTEEDGVTNRDWSPQGGGGVPRQASGTTDSDPYNFNTLPAKQRANNPFLQEMTSYNSLKTSSRDNQRHYDTSVQSFDESTARQNNPFLRMLEDTDSSTAHAPNLPHDHVDDKILPEPITTSPPSDDYLGLESSDL